MSMYGTIAEFKDPKSLYHAAEKVAKSGYKKFETYSPFPIHGMEDAMRLKPSIIGWIVFAGGAFGAIFGFGLQAWISVDVYQLTIAGKPFFSYPAFIPVTFELMVLFAAFCAVFGMLALNKLPQWYHGLFKYDRFKSVTTDGFFLSIESDDPKYDKDEVATFLKELGGTYIKEIEA